MTGFFAKLGWLLAAAATIGAGPQTVLAAQSAGCGKTPTIRSGATNALTVNSKSRQFIVRLPDNYNPSRPYKLIFTFHALGGSASQIANGGMGSPAYYGLPPLSNNSAIFISPNGQTAGSVGGFTGWGNTGGEDILFVDAILKYVEEDLCVDTNLRFSTGFSYGGAISYAVACARAKDFRAIAVMSSNAISGCAGGRDPIAYYHQHGTKDQALPVQGGRTMRDNMIRNNGCTPVSPEPQPAAGRLSRTDYKGCDAKYPTTWVIFDGDHTPTFRETGAATSFSPQYVWDWFNQFT